MHILVINKIIISNNVDLHRLFIYVLDKVLLRVIHTVLLCMFYTSWAIQQFTVGTPILPSTKFFSPFCVCSQINNDISIYQYL